MPRCPPSCPPRRSFVASDARRCGQLCTVPTRPRSTYRSGKTVQTNGTISVFPALYAEAFAKEMGKSNHGTLALIGSVAGDRGRKSNYVYGAANRPLKITRMPSATCS